MMISSWIFPPGPLPVSEQEIRPVYRGLLVGAVALAVVLPSSRVARRTAVGLACLAVALSTTWTLVGEWESPVGADPYLAHEAAGAALLDGEDPYGEAVQFPDGSPFAPPDAVVIGYPYPPVTLLTYGTTAGLTDPRIVSVAAWFVVIGALAWRSLRRDRADAAFAGFLIVASTPIWLVTLYTAWTEPLQIALFAAAMWLWRRHVVWSAVLLGLALASKQYFIVLLPLLLLMKVERRVTRLAVAGLVALVAWAPPLLVDASNYLDATVRTPLSFGFRPDTLSLPGLMAAMGIDFSMPHWLWLGMVAVIGVVAGRMIRSRTDLTAGAALVLGVSFWTGLAFANYWFLIMGLSVAALWLGASDVNRDSGELEGSARVSHI